MSITADELRALTRYIYSISGVALDASKAYLVETRLKPMVQQYACASYMDLYTRAKADRSGAMEKEIISAITTNETLFFRDASPFEVFKHKIIPDLVDARSKRGARRVPIRIWSAACSTGQEIYSIAIALRETLGNLDNFDISLLGTDISDDALAKASLGHYNKFEIERGLPPQTLHRYFVPLENGWKIRDEIRGMATFKKFNLMKPFAGLGKFDVIFCRNVAIYFTPADKKAVFEKIAGALEPDGALIIGSTESLTGVTAMYEPRRYLRSVFYQPVSGAASAAPIKAVSVPPAPPVQRSVSLTSRPASAAPAPPPRPSVVAAPPLPSHPEPPLPVDTPPTPQPVEPAVEHPATESPVSSPPPPRPILRAAPRVVGDKSALKRMLLEKKQRLGK